MKKIVALLVLFFAFSFNASAQEKTINELAKEDAKLLCDYLELKGAIVNDFVTLFEMKHETFQNEGVSEERKAYLSDIIEKKILATLDSSDIEKLDMEPSIMKKVTGKK
jgi:hypothetical protein